MRKHLFIASILCGALFTSCRKFDHKQTAPASCELCTYADQLEGVYNGIASGPYVEAHTGGNLTDSMKLYVEHVFMGNGGYVDSTIMYLKLTSKFQSANDSTTRIIEMHSLGNYTYFDPEDPLCKFILTPDSVYIKNVSSHFGSDPTTILEYPGTKQ